MAYKDATKGLRDESAMHVLQGLYAHHGLAADRKKLITEAYASADDAIMHRVMHLSK